MSVFLYLILNIVFVDDSFRFQPVRAMGLVIHDHNLVQGEHKITTTTSNLLIINIKILIREQKFTKTLKTCKFCLAWYHRFSSTLFVGKCFSKMQAM